MPDDRHRCPFDQRKGFDVRIAFERKSFRAGTEQRSRLSVIARSAGPDRLATALQVNPSSSTYCALILPARMTFPHFSVSPAMNFPYSAGVIGIAEVARSARRSVRFGSTRAASTARLSVSMISGGVSRPSPAGRQPRTVATASKMVHASTASKASRGMPPRRRAQQHSKSLQSPTRSAPACSDYRVD